MPYSSQRLAARITDADAHRAVRAVVDAFVANGAVGTCIGASMLLAERRRGGVVVEGYLVNDRARCGCRHYWYREDGVDYDVATMIYRDTSRAREGVVDTDAVSTRVSECLPSAAEAAHPSCGGYALVSNAEEDRATAALFAAWSRDPRRAWAGCPRWLHALRGGGGGGGGGDPKNPHSKNRAFLSAFVGPDGSPVRHLLVACLVCALYALLRAWWRGCVFVMHA